MKITVSFTDNLSASDNEKIVTQELPINKHCVLHTIPHIVFLLSCSLSLFLKKIKAHGSSGPRVYLLQSQLLNQWSNRHETWYERHATGRTSTFVLFTFLPSVVPTCHLRELLWWIP
jgi:hypothetical protein